MASSSPASFPPNKSFKPTPCRGFVETSGRAGNTASHPPRSARLNSGVRPHGEFMKRFFLAIFLSAFAFACEATESDLSAYIQNPKARSIVSPYYQCMKSKISTYAKKSPSTQAAKAACSNQRSVMIKSTSDEFILDMPRDMADRNASEVADEIEIKIRPLYVKAALDAK
jgi:hypothetical protein